VPDKCTVFGKVDDGSAVVDALEQVTDLRVEVEGERNRWQRITVSGPNGTLRFTATRPTGPPDKFSQLILGTHNFVMQIPHPDRNYKQSVAHRIAVARIIIGVVGEPDFDAEEEFPDCIMEVAEHTGGVILNQGGVLDAAGNPLLMLGEGD
jgi:hypothetical protein